MAPNTFDANNHLMPLHKDEGKAIYDRILELLPSVYPRQSSQYELKDFTIFINMHTHQYAATAVARLSMPRSLGEDNGAVLCDEFLECYDPHSALGALKRLEEDVKEKLEGLEKGRWGEKECAGLRSMF